MNCPVCNVPLTMTDRQGVEIDYCPKCRGVWLDRGELDKIIERSAGDMPRQATETRYEEPYKDRERYPKQHDSYYGHKKKKKESFLSDLFDF